MHKIALLLLSLFFYGGSLAAESSLAISQQDFEKQLHTYIKADPSQPMTVGVITINDRDSGINQSTWLYVKSALEYYKKTQPTFVILELNTPGGEVFPAQQISDALKELDIQSNIPVVAYINNWAISAGAMLAYSARFIVIVKDAAYGGCRAVNDGRAEDGSGF